MHTYIYLSLKIFKPCLRQHSPSLPRLIAACAPCATHNLRASRSSSDLKAPTAAQLDLPRHSTNFIWPGALRFRLKSPDVEAISTILEAETASRCFESETCRSSTPWPQSW